MTIVTQTKIAKIIFQSGESGDTQWTDDSEINTLDERFNQTFQMMNGKKIKGKKKALFAFGNASNGVDAANNIFIQEDWKDKTPESKAEDTITIN